MEGFLILDKIGEGAFSSVYKVKRKEDGLIYALKKIKFLKLKEKEKLNSLNEIRILSSINSQNVISYKEAFFDEKDSTLNIIMEYADKGDLFKLISEYKKKKDHFEESEVWDALIQLLNGLKALHDLNILHRDLKSANVFLFSNGLAKLGDLNVSKVTRKGLGYTQTGTPYYASPEVWKNQAYDSKSDIWSLGCVIYEMCKLIPPFQAKSMDELYKKIVRGFYPQIPSRYSDDLKEIIKIMIQTEVGARPSCDELLKMTIIQKKTEMINKNLIELNNNSDVNKKLLSTIRIPSEFSNFSINLPKAKYYSPSNSENNQEENYKNNNGDSSQFQDLFENKNNIKNNYNLFEKGKVKLNNLKIKENKNISILNKNSGLLSPIKIKDKDLILSENDKKKINKIPSIISPSHINEIKIKERYSDKIILTEIKNYKNIRNYNSIEKSKINKRIKIINNYSKDNASSSYKALQSENNVNEYDKNIYKYFLNLKLSDIIENQRIINKNNFFKKESPKNMEEKFKNLRENRQNLYNNCNNNIVNRVMKHQYNLMKKYILHNKEEYK